MLSIWQETQCLAKALKLVLPVLFFINLVISEFAYHMKFEYYTVLWKLHPIVCGIDYISLCLHFNSHLREMYTRQELLRIIANVCIFANSRSAFAIIAIRFYYPASIRWNVFAVKFSCRDSILKENWKNVLQWEMNKVRISPL